MPLPLISGAENDLLGILPPSSLRALNATSRQLRQQIQEHTCRLQLPHSHSIPLLLRHRWPRLTQLVFHTTQPNIHDFAALTEGKQTSLPALTHLRIRNQMTDPDTVYMLAQKEWSSLVTLDLSSDDSQWGACDDVMTSSCSHLSASAWPHLTSLNISGNSLSASAMAQLASGRWPMLHVLDISNLYHQAGYFCNDPVPGLAAAAWTGLRQLSLRNVAMDVKAAQHLESAHWPNLTKLDLSGCRCTGFESDDDEWDVVESVTWCGHIANCKWPQLAALDLSDNTFSADAVAALTRSSWPALKKLNLSQSGGNFVEQLAASPWTTLQELHLQKVSLSQDDLKHLQHMGFPQLTVLDLGHASIVNTEYEAPEFDNSWALAQNCWSLVKFRAGATVLFHCMVLTGWTTLRWLDIASLYLCPGQVVSLLQARGKTLDTLCVSCTAVCAFDASPEADDWPVNTFLLLEVSTDTPTLQSLWRGIWPANRVRLVSLTGAHYAVSALPELPKLNLSWMEELDMARTFQGCCDSIGSKHDASHVSGHLAAACMLQGFQTFNQASWTALTMVNLGRNGLTDAFVSPILSCEWPLLEVLDLSDNKLGVSAVRQLCRASWPLLTHLNLCRNEFSKTGVCVEVKAALLLQFEMRWPSLCVLLDDVDGGTMLDGWNSIQRKVPTVFKIC